MLCAVPKETSGKHPFRQSEQTKDLKQFLEVGCAELFESSGGRKKGIKEDR